MNRKNIIALIITFILTLQLLLSGGCSKVGSFKATDTNGNPLDEIHAEYSELALKDAAEILASAKGISVKKAEKQLKRGKYNVRTAFDPAVYTALEEAAKSEEGIGELGCAVVDTSGLLVAILSTGKAEKNNATTAVKPYGTLTPLSVYAPAIENGKATYSSAYLDAALLMVDDQKWPANPSGSYTMKKQTLATGAAQGLSTVAVRCLKETETDTAEAFFEKLGLVFKPAADNQDALLKALADGDDGIALSPVELAGYYRLFGNSGRYVAPLTVTAITDKDGNIVYEELPEETAMLQDSTTRIVNRLLVGATAKGGVAEAAALTDIEVAGTVGSGKEGHWFAGVTPAYSCAVWHDATASENRAPAIFAKALSKLPHSDKSFTSAVGVFQAVFCKESGMLYSKGCTKMQMGYYTAETRPDFCEGHK